jgi:hypothetical protein
MVFAASHIPVAVARPPSAAPQRRAPDAVDDRQYRCGLIVDEAASAFAPTVRSDGVSDRAIDATNQEHSHGRVRGRRRQPALRLEIAVDAPMVRESWVIETPQAGVSVMHSFTTP